MLAGLVWRSRRANNRGACQLFHCKPIEVPEYTPTVEDDSLESNSDSIHEYLAPDGGGIPASTLLEASIQADEPPQEETSSGLWADVGPLLKFALPTLCIAITSPLMSLADTSVVGLYSEAQLAAMSPATTVCDGIYYMMTFIPVAVTNLVSLNMARKNHAAAGALQFVSCSSDIFSTITLLPVELPQCCSIL